MRIPGQGNRSPADLRWFSMLQNGACGFLPREFEPVADTLDPEAIAEYGIDWEAYNNTHLQNHHAAANPMEQFPQNPFVTHRPDTLSMVQVEEARCPFNVQQLADFAGNISHLPDVIRLSREMAQRKQLWIMALAICREIRA